jgi:subtilase family serine protease
MRGFRPAAAGLALTGLLLAACTASPAVSTTASAQPAGGTADCDSVTTCYTPQQIQVAYGIKPLLDHGIDGRGETVVLPELAEPALNEPLVSNMRQDMARFDQVFHLPAAQLRVNTSLPAGWPIRGTRSARKCSTRRWCTSSRPAPPS